MMVASPATAFFVSPVEASTTPVKEIAKGCGWNGEKTDEARKFLSDLKALLTAYNEFPLNYLLNEQEDFLSDQNEILFVHIREPEEIEKFKKVSKTKTYALLVTPRDELKDKVYGNKSDDDVANYNYDFIFKNDKPLETAEQEWLTFIDENILNYELKK